MSHKEIAKIFISKCSNFETDLSESIDRKHDRIVKSSEIKIKKNFDNFVENFRSWEEQTDMGAPIQFTLEHFKTLSIKNNLKKLIKKIIFYEDKEFNRSFFDDVQIIKLSKADEILKDNPVHKTPGVKDFYIYENLSTNYRWNRYAYEANQILKKNLLKENDIHVDLGSYYGGLQSFLFKKLNSCKFFLVDFNHQLLRSFIFLKSQYPNANHILPDDVKDKFENNFKPGFYYLTIDNYFRLKSLKPTLFSNSFSLGEMTDEYFEKYLNSNILKSSRYLYLVNRFVSTPYFEKTYENTKNISSYFKIDGFGVKYFDIFPIHHYQVVKRKIFKKKAKRPISSSYFELILENKSL